MCTALVGCKPPAPEAVSAAVTGSTNVEVRSTSVYRAESSTIGSSQTYYIVCRLTFTNTLGRDVVPQAKNFVFYDAYGQPYPGMDSGATSLIGISNYAGTVKPDAKQDYTVGFRVPALTSGAVYYAPD
jgi:hypothetical protein